MVYYFVEELASASALCGCDGSPLHVHGSWFMVHGGEQAQGEVGDTGRNILEGRNGFSLLAFYYE